MRGKWERVGIEEKGTERENGLVEDEKVLEVGNRYYSAGARRWRGRSR